MRSSRFGTFSVLFLALCAPFLGAGQCNELVPKHYDTNYVPSVMVPAPARQLKIGWQIDHLNLEVLYVSPESQNDGARGFQEFFQAQGHTVRHLLPGTTDQIIDPVTGATLVTDVTAIALPRQEITAEETLQIIASQSKGFLIIIDHGFSPTEGGFPGFWGAVKNNLMPALGVVAENTSVNLCAGQLWCLIFPVQDSSISLLGNMGKIYTYEGSSFAPAYGSNQKCVLEFPVGTDDLLSPTLSLEGHCQGMAVTVGCKKFYLSASIEPFISYINLGNSMGFNDPWNPQGEEFAFAIMEWLGKPLAPGEETCPL